MPSTAPCARKALRKGFLHSGLPHPKASRDGKRHGNKREGLREEIAADMLKATQGNQHSRGKWQREGWLEVAEGCDFHRFPVLPPTSEI
jgi:hypothetical protein